ncbi:MAG TPA: sigma-54 dependent transcriptional regulator [Bryobacteraceae bacterium]|nr:sigma-54 dependent transcriptional regulator [Bryobacteraceae bacterium]
MRILWVCSDESPLAEWDIQKLELLGDYTVDVVSGAAAAIDALHVCSYNAVLTDLPLEGWSVQEWLEQAQRTAAGVPIALRTRFADVNDAMGMARAGAAACFERRTPLGDIARTLDQWRSGQPSRTAAPEAWRRLLVGESPAMERVAEFVRLAGPRRSSVLITGESGTGKELVARALHQASPRAALPLVAVNCNALPDALLEAELFGHVRGAFTGAVQQRIGRFEMANRGTLFLDEIGDISTETQAKLLRVLQEREVQRLGSSEPIRLDVRIIAATNADLGDRIRERRFREDLYYRLNVLTLRVPALRERTADIPFLVEHFIEMTCREEGLPSKRVGRDTLARLTEHHWPGNIRQLENAVASAAVLSGERKNLYPSDFPLTPPALVKIPPATATAAIPLPDDGLDFEGTVTRIERSILEQALKRTQGNKKAAAQMLRLKRTTLAAKLKSLEAIAM